MPELAQRAEDPDRDLAAVRDEHFREEAAWRRVFSPKPMTLPDQLTVARAASVPLVVLLYAWDFPHNEYWATALFCVAMATDWLDGRIARRRGVTSQLGSLLDPIADKVLVLAVLVMLIDDGVWPAWMVAAIVAREILISGLRLAAIERGVVIAARDLGKLKTWAQAIAAALGGFAAAGAWDDSIAWWALLVALVLTWVSGLDYARARRACCAERPDERADARQAAWRGLHQSPKAAQAFEVAGELRQPACDLDLDRDHADRAERLLGGAGGMISTATAHVLL